MSEPTIGSLCTGYGGLTMGIQSVLGGRVLWNAEYEPPTSKQPNPPQAAAKLLAHHYPDVPNLGDLTKINWATVPAPTIYEGGTPCQDVSHAGARRGMRAGTRSGLWSSFVEGIDVLRPELVIWENVRGVTYAEADSDVEPCPICMGDGSGDALRALGRVLGDLADLRYDARWVGLPASAVDAPHERFRVFVAAYPSGGRWGPGGEALGWYRAQADAAGRGSTVADAYGSGSEGPQPAGGRDLTDGRAVADPDRYAVREQPVTLAGRGGQALAGQAGDPVPHAQGQRRGEGRPEPAGLGRGSHAAQRGAAAPDTDRDGLARVAQRDSDPPAGREVQQRDHADGRAVVDWGRYRGAVERWERVLGRPAPAPSKPNRNGTPKLSAEFDEWLMGLPAGWVSDVPGISWNAKLKLCGNGVVPQQAAAAVRHLLDLP